MKRYQRIILGGAIPWIWIGAAHAGGHDVPTQQAATQRAAQMLPLEFEPRQTMLVPLVSDPRLPFWLPSQLEVRKGRGLAVSRPVRMGTKDLRLSVSGPVLRKRNLGLAFEVNF